MNSVGCHQNNIIFGYKNLNIWCFVFLKFFTVYFPIIAIPIGIPNPITR